LQPHGREKRKDREMKIETLSFFFFSFK
jgi:hypothetical protein